MQKFTKLAIINSFMGLLNKNPLNKITIKDIVDDCGINRSTFYYYYEDIYALLSEVLEIETQKITNIEEGDFSWDEAFEKSTSFARENKKAIYHIYNSVNREILDKYLYSVVEHMISNVVRYEVKDFNVSEENIKIVVDVYKFALVGMIYDWLRNGMKQQDDDRIRKMYNLLGDNAKNALARTDDNYIVTTTITKKSDIIK